MSECPYKIKCNGKDCLSDFCLRKFKLDYLFDYALIPESQRKYFSLVTDADGTDYQEFMQLASIEKDAEEFVKSGKNLYIHSAICGNGKSSWAIRILKSYLFKTWAQGELTCKALFISVPRFLLALKDNISNRNEYAEHIQKYIATADLVIWDDIAAKVGSEFELNHLLSLLETRIAGGKSNIFTSNLSDKQMTEALGERITSRICNLSINIELHGSDKRKIKEQLENQDQGGNQ